MSDGGDGNTYPLTRVHLRNFKSVREAQVDLQPLTVLVGANSSGKSTLLQALLALHQVAAGGATTGTFPLNGPKSRLGMFDKVRFWGAGEGDAIGLGVDATIAGLAEVYPAVLTPAWFELMRTFRHPKDVRLCLDLQVDAEVGDPAVPAIAGATLSTSVRGSQLHAGLEVRRRGKVARVVSIDEIFTGDMLVGTGTPIHTSMRGYLTGQKRTRIDGVAFDGGVPTALVSQTPENVLLAEAWVSYLPLLRASTGKVATKADVRRVAKAAKRSLEAWAREGGLFGDLIRSAIEELARSDLRATAFRVISTRRAELIELLAESWPRRSRLRHLLSDEDAAVNAQGSAGVVGLLGSSIHYLTGLRVAPQPLYPFTPMMSEDDIGIRGENLAAVLNATSERMVLNPRLKLEPQWTTLTSALEYWTRNLGLVRSVGTDHQGAAGIGLRVGADDDHAQLDLAAVGTGVSQVLPVLVRCLLATPGQVVLLEQPELHLHPQAQLAIGDFLLEIVRSGRQLIVETHSEHLLNRIRRRCAEDRTESSETSSLIGVLLTSRDEVTGETTYRKVTISRTGALDGIPTGYFPEGTDEVLTILEAGLREDSEPL